MRRVLLVSPNFPPVNAPDMQRVRMALPWLADFGWEPTVLALDPAEGDGFIDKGIGETVPAGIPVVRCGAIPRRWTSRIGWRTAAMRCLPFVYRAGSKLLSEGRFDVVFISTTIFPVMALGARWRARFGVPYLLDFQDPWRSDAYRRPGAPPPPGGRLKYAVSQRIAATLEPLAVKGASHIVCVSPAYKDQLLHRYPEKTPDDFTILPFGAPDADFALLRRRSDIRQTIFDPHDGLRHWVYVGVLGPMFETSLRLIFGALAECRRAEPEQAGRLRFHFVGTNYARGGQAREYAMPLAREAGVADLVTEEVARVPYLEGIRLLLDAEGILLPGTSDPAYTASKLMTCLLAEKPFLPMFHCASNVLAMLRDFGAVDVGGFDPGDLEHGRKLAERLMGKLLDGEMAGRPAGQWHGFTRYTARSMTETLAGLFDNVCRRHKEDTSS